MAAPRKSLGLCPRTEPPNVMLRHHHLQPEQSPTPGIVTQNPGILELNSTVHEHKNKRQNMARWGIFTDFAATMRSQARIERLPDLVCGQVPPSRDKPLCAGSNSAVTANLKGRTLCRFAIIACRVRNHHHLIYVTTKSNGYRELEKFQSRIQGVITHHASTAGSKNPR